ncbi:MAG TPA: cytochrome P450 [Herpetosiphonaceae bacterium]
MFDANFIANPYPAYQHMLANGRIHWLDFAGGAWLVPHYADVMTLFRDPRFTTARADLFSRQFSDEDRQYLRGFEEITRLWLAAMNGEEHLRLRRLLNKAFTPRVVEAMRPRVQRLTNELIDAFFVAGEVDLMSQFAHQLPALVIGQLLGVPREDRSRFVDWSDHIATFFSSPKATIEQGRAANDALVAMREYFRPIVAERRQHPGDDLISHMIAVEEQGEMFSEDQLLSQCTLFLFAGHETTQNLIGNGMMALIEHPDQLELLRNNPDLLQSALDEIVRYDCPVQLIPRLAAEDVELWGQQIKQGQALHLMLGAANRDAEQFPDPDRFDITRSYKRPATFGFGAHFCIGMPLAMLEIETALTTLIRRLPNLRLAGEAERSPNVTLRGFRRLPLAFDTVQSTIVDETLVAA